MRAGHIFLCVLVACAQNPVFPSDGQDPKQAGGAELLEAVCPGRVVTGKEVKCRIVCPKFTSFPGEDFGWSLARVTRGHFLSPTSEDAVLSMEGCEPHSVNFGGTILLTRHSQRWIVVWYKAGIDTEQCHKVLLRSGREILVCLSGAGAQGALSTALNVEDLRSPTSNGMAVGEKGGFFGVFDDTLTCGLGLGDDSPPNPVRHEYIERVTFGAGVLSVIAHHGTRSMTSVEAEQCLKDPKNFIAPTRRYRIDFIFNGYDYKLAPSSTAAIRFFERH